MKTVDRVVAAPRACVAGSQTRQVGYWLVLVLVASLVFGHAEDDIRASLAGEEAAAARRKLDAGPDDYNLKTGPVYWNLSGSFGIEFNDNVNLSENDEDADIILRPEVQLQGQWQITQLNTLDLTLGIGYAKYLFNGQYDAESVLIAPGSALDFNVYVGDFRFTFFDRFSFQADPLDQPTLSGVADFGRFTNEAGVDVDWDLNEMILSAGYSHTLFIATADEFDYLDRQDHNLRGRVTFLPAPTLSTGAFATASWSDYDSEVLNDGTSLTVGPFIEQQISDYIEYEAQAGVRLLFFDQGGTIGDSDELNSFFASARVTHRVNSAVTQTLEVSHDSALGLVSNYLTLTRVRHGAEWQIINDVTLSTDLFFEDGEESDSAFAEDFIRYGGGFRLGYQLTRKLDTGLGYRFIHKDSNQNGQDYTQNRLLIDMRYDF